MALHASVLVVIGAEGRLNRVALPRVLRQVQIFVEIINWLSLHPVVNLQEGFIMFWLWRRRIPQIVQLVDLLLELRDLYVFGVFDCIDLFFFVFNLVLLLKIILLVDEKHGLQLDVFSLFFLVLLLELLVQLDLQLQLPLYFVVVFETQSQSIRQLLRSLFHLVQSLLQLLVGFFVLYDLIEFIGDVIIIQFRLLLGLIAFGLFFVWLFFLDIVRFGCIL